MDYKAAAVESCAFGGNLREVASWGVFTHALDLSAITFEAQRLRSVGTVKTILK